MEWVNCLPLPSLAPVLRMMHVCTSALNRPAGSPLWAKGASTHSQSCIQYTLCTALGDLYNALTVT